MDGVRYSQLVNTANRIFGPGRKFEFSPRKGRLVKSVANFTVTYAVQNRGDFEFAMAAAAEQLDIELEEGETFTTASFERTTTPHDDGSHHTTEQFGQNMTTRMSDADPTATDEAHISRIQGLIQLWQWEPPEN